MTKQEKESLLSHRRTSSVAGSSYGAIKYQSLDSRPNSNFMCTTRDSVVVSIALLTTCILISVTLGIGLPKIEERKLYIPRPSTTTQLQIDSNATTGGEAFTTTQLQTDATTGAQAITTIGRTSASAEVISATSRQEETSDASDANATLLQGAPLRTDKKKFVLFQQKCLRNCLIMDC